MAGRGFSPEVEAALERASKETGVPISTLRTFTRIESGGDPRNVTGSYRGLLQLSPSEFAKYGGTGDIHDPYANALAGARKIMSDSSAFEKKFGRAPTDADRYMIHQQGEGGYAAHMANPDQPAWMNMASTGEGRKKGEGWAKQAIWGNVPDQLKAKYGSVENMTSQQFMDLWASKVNGGPPTGAFAAAPQNASGSLPAASPSGEGNTPASPAISLAGLLSAASGTSGDGGDKSPFASLLSSAFGAGSTPSSASGGQGGQDGANNALAQQLAQSQRAYVQAVSNSIPATGSLFGGQRGAFG